MNPPSKPLLVCDIPDSDVAFVVIEGKVFTQTVDRAQSQKHGQMVKA